MAKKISHTRVNKISRRRWPTLKKKRNHGKITGYHLVGLCYDGCLTAAALKKMEDLKADRINIFIITVPAELITRLITLAISDQGPLGVILPL